MNEVDNEREVAQTDHCGCCVGADCGGARLGAVRRNSEDRMCWRNKLGVVSLYLLFKSIGCLEVSWGHLDRQSFD